MTSRTAQKAKMQPDPYATWDPSKATDEPDNLPDRRIVPLVEHLKAAGIVTLQSCVGHLTPNSDGETWTGYDGCLWIRANSVTMKMIKPLLGTPFMFAKRVYWPEKYWEFIWHPDDADEAMDLLKGLAVL